MKNLIGCFIMAAVLWLISSIFPESVYIDSIETLIVVSIAMVVLDIILGILSFVFLIVPYTVKQNAFTISLIVLFIFIAIFSCPIELAILSSNLDGFNINSFGAYILLSILRAVIVYYFKKGDKSKSSC